jgi:uroporphyrinogen III methyltransferase/synthase
VDPAIFRQWRRGQPFRLFVSLLQAPAQIGRDEERMRRIGGHGVILKQMAKGKVYLVGAGPGDPGLITLRAVEILRSADAVLYDYLVNPEILRHCRSDAILVSLGKHGSGRVKTQEEINGLLTVLAEGFATVVRLKSGDPMVFARASDELACLAKQGIPFEIVPGVTAAVAAASYAGIPVTHRDVASAVAFVTGQEDAAKSESALDYAALARFPGTLVFYMGVTTAGQWSAALIKAGKLATTPVAVLRRVSFPDQQRIDTTLGDVAAVVHERKLRPPVVFVIGDVAREGGDWLWFEKRSLFGQKVLVTRPMHQADELARPLAELGAEVLIQPAIEIKPLQLSDTSDRSLDLLDRFDWIVFSSSNGVRNFFDRLLSPFQGERDIRALGKLKIAAIGPATAEELERYHLRADVVPDEFRAESLAESLRGSAAGKKFLLIRASRGREVLAEQLTAAGGLVEQVVVYESIDVEKPDADIAAKMSADQIDWTTVTSSAIARSLARIFGDSLKQTKLVSISPITSATLRELGYEPAAEAKEYTMAGVVEAIRSCS